MKKKYFINANIVDPYNSLNENGGLIVGEDGKIEGIEKKLIQIIYRLEKNTLILTVNIFFQE